MNQFDWRDFGEHRNPVAAAFLARMRRTVTEKPTVLRHAYELLLRLRLSAVREYPVVNFLEAYLPLSAEEKQAFHAEVNQFPEKRREAIMGKAMGFLEEGRQEGRLEATRQMVCRLLRKRLGSLDAASEARVAALSLRRLERLSEALLDFTAPADLEGWLKSHTRKG